MDLIIILIFMLIGMIVKWKNKKFEIIFWTFMIISLLAQVAKYLYLCSIIK